ncbi:hypothetical protein JRQ81_012205 [Phrynocephalus forsythii]|uniref:Uncharacterized protein n=1 Tax=Phrynocephalus forsythii TaxID=171643 RepID=A0A9Q1AQA2_9SAUR|nr:hypothetical protein JRQ81_012205 [Phrynocephalus forsythii]
MSSPPHLHSHDYCDRTQRAESPTSMDEQLPELSEYDDNECSYCSDSSSPMNLPTPKSDVADTQPPSPSEDLKLYSQAIHKIANVMDLQLLQDDTTDNCRFFGHLNKNQVPPLRLAFIPSLLKRIKEPWSTPSSIPLMSRRVDNMYRTHGEGTAFLDKHPLPNSVIVDAVQNHAKGRSSTAPINKEGRKLDLIGHRHYSLASFSLCTSNYLCAMEAYTRHLLTEILPVINSVPEEQKSKLTAFHAEVLSLIDYETIAAQHLADAASKQLATAIHLRRHAWLHTTNITDDARNRIEDFTFDGEGLFASTTDQSIDNLIKMRKNAKSISNQPQQPYRWPQQPWHRQVHTTTQRPQQRPRPNYSSPSYRPTAQKPRQPQSNRRFDRKGKQNL